MLLREGAAAQSMQEILGELSRVEILDETQGGMTIDELHITTGLREFFDHLEGCKAISWATEESFVLQVEMNDNDTANNAAREFRAMGSTAAVMKNKVTLNLVSLGLDTTTLGKYFRAKVRTVVEQPE